MLSDISEVSFKFSPKLFSGDFPSSGFTWLALGFAQLSVEWVCRIISFVGNNIRRSPFLSLSHFPAPLYLSLPLPFHLFLYYFFPFFCSWFIPIIRFYASSSYSHISCLFCSPLLLSSLVALQFGRQCRTHQCYGYTRKDRHTLLRNTLLLMPNGGQPVPTKPAVRDSEVGQSYFLNLSPGVQAQSTDVRLTIQWHLVKPGRGEETNNKILSKLLHVRMYSFCSLQLLLRLNVVLLDHLSRASCPNCRMYISCKNISIYHTRIYRSML